MFRPQATGADVLAIGEIRSLCEQVYNSTGRQACAVVLHPEYLPEYSMLDGLPVIRSELAPRDRALVAWGSGT